MRPRRSKSAREGGYVLLSIMLLMTLMLIALSIEAPRIAQQVKREKEEELMHRGNEYKNAVKKYFRKFGNYPVSLDQLQSANGMRFLRKRYKDPFTGKDDWRILHVGEVQVNMVNGAISTAPQVGQSPGEQSSAGTGQVGTMGQPAVTGQAGTIGQTGTLGQQGTIGQPGTGQPIVTPQPGMMSQPIGGGSFNQSSNQSPGLNLSNSNSSAGGQIQGGTQGFATGGITPAGGMPGVSNSPVVGGGQIIGVESTSKLKAIKVVNGKDHYNEWPFFYDPRAEVLNGGAPPVAGINPATGTNPGQGFGPPAPGQQPAPNTPPANTGVTNQ